MRTHSNPAPEASAKTARTARRKRFRERSKPFYDSELRELRVGRILVKCFTQGSDAQEVILTSFQEENWCRNIDDPLPVKHGQDAKQRLRTAVANLNRRQRVPLLHFQVIRQGTGVAWRFLEDSDSRATQE